VDPVLARQLPFGHLRMLTVATNRLEQLHS